MPLLESSDHNFMSLLDKFPQVIIKYYTTEEIERNEFDRLAIFYENLSNTQKYKDIVFVKMNADNNLIAKKFISSRKLPFVAVYKKGLLVECGTVSEEEDVVNMLEALLTIDIKL